MQILQVSADGHELAQLLIRPEERGARQIVGISGAPGSGKSTLATFVASAHPGSVVVPMDGFHFADVELDRRGLRAHKGAPETFDGWGYAALLARVRSEPDHIVLAPAFERHLEQPLAGAIPIPPETTEVITEGNYLLLNDPPWTDVRRQLDVVWHVRVADALRRERLIERHVRFGKTPDEARAWVAAVDEPNARAVEAVANSADLILEMTDWSGASP
jgi:pantothenate kinase